MSGDAVLILVDVQIRQPFNGLSTPAGVSCYASEGHIHSHLHPKRKDWMRHNQVTIGLGLGPKLEVVHKGWLMSATWLIDPSFAFRWTRKHAIFQLWMHCSNASFTPRAAALRGPSAPMLCSTITQTR